LDRQGSNRYFQSSPMTGSKPPKVDVVPTETVYSQPAATPSADDSWWGRYSINLGDFTETSRAILEVDCTYIVNRGVFGAGDPSHATWPESRARRGLVMGSVQSGKTASMLGTIALSLDRGVDVVVILAGTRLSLWQQTLTRVQQQLDSGPESVEKRRRRILVPKTPPTSPIPLAMRYQLTPVHVERALSRRQPIIVVALKHANHLQALRQSLNSSVFPAIQKEDRAIHMLVLDDEADDGSVLDANVEASQDPVFGNLKQIPRAIVDLWSPPSKTTPQNLFATYVGYTATPQANFLQEEHNPLAPRDFLATLRTPFDRGEPIPRSSTYTEPLGLSHYYTGGETFYHRGRNVGLCLTTTTNSEDDLATAIRAYLVAAAIRLHRGSAPLGPHEAARTSFESVTAAKTAAPSPQAMLIHPSANVDDHFTAAENVLMWAGAVSRFDARAQLDSGRSYLPDTLLQKLETEEAKWSIWLDRYRDSATKIHVEFNTPSPRSIPDWSVIKELLTSEVIPGTRVAVINSDPAADDRPEYVPVRNQDGTWRAPKDMSTIFVSGNVMARGLTLEGLSTTLFLRTSNNPLSDTQMQMQRWFGYRGAYIELCRVFASEGQLSFFADYHDVDEALRNVIADAMRDNSESPRPVVLQGERFLATGKIANLGNKPLHPGRKPFIPIINSGEREDPNEQLVFKLFSQRESKDVTAGGRLRGRILAKPLSLLDAAEILDGLSFDAYQPGADNWLGRLWSQVETRVNAIQPMRAGNHLYRPAEPSSGPASPVRKDCPYAIPAYFRLWEACSSRLVRGLFATGQRDALWSLTDLVTKRSQRPNFWVGIRYGSGAPAEGLLAKLPYRIDLTQKQVINGGIRGTWGANNPDAGPGEYRGDEYFDYYFRNEPLPPIIAGEEPWRPAGSDGQILFYVNQLPGQAHPAIAVGVCVPTGGPDQFAAYVQPARRPPG
jgi:hypothetical protein